MHNLIRDEFDDSVKGGWELPESLKENISEPHDDAEITADDIYNILSRLDDDIVWWLINNEAMTFCEGFVDA